MYLALRFANKVDRRPLCLLEYDGSIWETQADVRLCGCHLALTCPRHIRDLEVANNDLWQG